MPKLLRTALFVPGNRPDRIEKAYQTEADAIIVDLEDAVPFTEKENCRGWVREKTAQVDEKTVLIRVNALNTPYLRGDLEEALSERIEGIVLPKVEGPEDVLKIHTLLLEAETRKGLTKGHFRLFPLIESALGVQRIYEIVTADIHPRRIWTVAFGAADFTLDLGIEMTLEGRELFYARSKISIACRAGDIAPPLDTPFMLDIKDAKALTADALKAKELGFQGKLVIHPIQIEPCNRVFSPTREEISKARQVVVAFEKGEAEGKAAIQLEGRFIDYPVFERAKRLLALAEEAEKRAREKRHE